MSASPDPAPLDPALRTVIVEWLDDNYHFGDADSLITDNEMSFLHNGILDSLGFVQLILFIEERLTLRVDRGDLSPDNFDGMGKMVRYLVAHPDYRGV